MARTKTTAVRRAPRKQVPPVTPKIVLPDHVPLPRNIREETILQGFVEKQTLLNRSREPAASSKMSEEERASTAQWLQTAKLPQEEEEEEEPKTLARKQQKDQDDDPAGRYIHIVNKSDGKVDIFWVNPNTQELVKSVDVGTDHFLLSYIGHEFEVQEIPNTRRGENEECRKTRFVVTNNEDQRVIITKEITIEYEDARSRAMENKRIIQECARVTVDALFKHKQEPFPEVKLPPNIKAMVSKIFASHMDALKLKQEPSQSPVIDLSQQHMAGDEDLAIFTLNKKEEEEKKKLAQEVWKLRPAGEDEEQAVFTLEETLENEIRAIMGSPDFDDKVETLKSIGQKLCERLYLEEFPKSQRQKVKEIVVKLVNEKEEKEARNLVDEETKRPKEEDKPAPKEATPTEAAVLQKLQEATNHAEAMQEAMESAKQSLLLKDDDDDNNKYTEAFFQQWLDQNKAKLEPLLPKLNATHWKFFEAACQHVQDSNTALQSAMAKRKEIQKHKPVDQDALDKANKAVDAATAALKQAQTDALNASDKLLEEFNQHPLAEPTYQLLLATNVLVDATPKGLAKYCASTTQDHKKALVQLLQDPRQFDLLQAMALAGGAKHGQWGRALELYNELETFVLKDKHQALWERMALAVALEFADPLVMFGYKDRYIDPIHRYLHYQQAVQFGELDPIFETEFGVWELRMALNSVAPDDQIAWGRQMLRNYRPDLMQLNDRWRYCRIVRTDVFYTGHPNWDKTKPLDMKQVLSGGGECGPRAWMGRFACRAFGIPVWGAREPGHAAMTRWTPNEGWVVCLGAEMSYAWWEEEGGLHFQVSAAARKALQNKEDLNKPDLEYGLKVMVLEWMANVNQEPDNQVVRHALAEPAALWRSLSLMQMRRLAPPPSAAAELLIDEESPLVPQLEHLKLRNCTVTEQIATLPTGTILIPASTATSKWSSKVMLMDSFLGGKQVFFDKDGAAEYTLVSPPGGKYQLTCHFVTVHDDPVKPPLLLTIDSSVEDDEDDDEVVVVNLDDEDDNDKDNVCSVYSIPLQCTWGLWEETKPVVVELPKGVATCQISVSREATAHGLVIKEFKLVPVKGE